MSDQPTSEWTADYVADRFTIDAATAGHIADAHNAALESAKQDFAKQIAAERDKVQRQEHYIKHLEACVENMPKGMGDLTRELLQLREQLAAERLEVDERGRTIIHYKQQLAAEKAQHILDTDTLSLFHQQQLAAAQGQVQPRSIDVPEDIPPIYTEEE